MSDSDNTSPRLVLIEWVDSYGCSSRWAQISDVQPELMVCQSVGWLIYDDEQCKVILPHRSTGDHPNAGQQGCEDMTIPTVAVVSITDLIVTPQSEGEKRKPYQVAVCRR